MGTTGYSIPQTQANRNVGAYKKHEIEMASPQKLILHLYDLGVQACIQQNSEKAGAVLAELINALNFDTGGEVSVGFFRLYQYCIAQVHQGEFDSPCKILKDLRQTWQKAMSQFKAA